MKEEEVEAKVEPSKYPVHKTRGHYKKRVKTLSPKAKVEDCGKCSLRESCKNKKPECYVPL